MQDKNSNPPISFFKAKLESFLSVTADPATITSLGSNDMFEKFFPNFITTPSYNLSLNKTLDPAPIIKIFFSE